MNVKKIVFATGNPNKLKEIKNKKECFFVVFDSYFFPENSLIDKHGSF